MWNGRTFVMILALVAAGVMVMASLRSQEWGILQSSHAFPQAFSGSSAFDTAKAEQVIQQAEARRDGFWKQASWYRFGGTVATWVAAGLSVGISVLAAFYGQSPPPNGTPGGAGSPPVGSLPERVRRCILVMAALAAGVNSAGSMLQGSGDRCAQRGTAAHATIYKQVAILERETVTHAEAQQALGELELVAKEIK